MRDETPADRFTRHLNALTRGIGEMGLYWAGDLAQFRVYANRVIHLCGETIHLESAGERRLDMIAQIATTHLLGCELRQGQAPMPPEPEHPNPGTTAEGPTPDQG